MKDNSGTIRPPTSRNRPEHREHSEYERGNAVGRGIDGKIGIRSIRTHRGSSDKHTNLGAVRRPSCVCWFGGLGFGQRPYGGAERSNEKAPMSEQRGFEFGGASGIRTPDLWIMIPSL